MRGQYQALSQDPNSLSNLDQDLPNNMIHQVTCHHTRHKGSSIHLYRFLTTTLAWNSNSHVMCVLQVPIKSLPQDWLWCETWCSKETLKTAKSIDLCNNPLTKVTN